MSKKIEVFLGDDDRYYDTEELALQADAEHAFNNWYKDNELMEEYDSEEYAVDAERVYGWLQGYLTEFGSK